MTSPDPPEPPDPLPHPPHPDEFRGEDGTVNWTAFRAAVDAWRPWGDKGKDED